MLREMADKGERVGPFDGASKSSNKPLLDSLDVTKMQSSRWQEIAEVLEPVFEVALDLLAVAADRIEMPNGTVWHFSLTSAEAREVLPQAAALALAYILARSGQR
jgi:hypothetical protein